MYDHTNYSGRYAGAYRQVACMHVYVRGAREKYERTYQQVSGKYAHMNRPREGINVHTDSFGELMHVHRYTIQEDIHRQYHSIAL
jgi:hypothetical protein